MSGQMEGDISDWCRGSFATRRPYLAEKNSDIGPSPCAPLRLTAADSSFSCFSPTSHVPLFGRLPYVAPKSIYGIWPSLPSVPDELREDPFLLIWPFRLNLISGIQENQVISLTLLTAKHML